MRIPAPHDMSGYDLTESETHQSHVNTIVDRFLTAVKTKDYHSTDQRTNTVRFPVNEDWAKDAAFADAVNRLSVAGWCVHYARQTCAMGWFHAIVWEP